MSQFFQIHTENPQIRLIRQAADILRGGGVIVYPTDSGYALGCLSGDKEAIDRIRLIRQLGDRHHFTLVCSDLSEIATYAKVGNSTYRLLRQLTPGPYTFILVATREVPRRLQHPKRKTIGIRVPQNAIALALLNELGEAMMSTSLILPGDETPLNDPYEFRMQLERQVDLIIDGGYGELEPTTVLDLVEDVPVVLRQGKGDTSQLGG